MVFLFERPGYKFVIVKKWLDELFHLIYNSPALDSFHIALLIMLVSVLYVQTILCNLQVHF